MRFIKIISIFCFLQSYFLCGKEVFGFNKLYLHSLTSFRAQQYGHSLAYLKEFEEEFSEEDEFHKDGIQKNFFFMKAFCLLYTANYSEAIEPFNQCLFYFDNNEILKQDLGFCLAVCLENSGKREEAKKVLLKLSEECNRLEERDFIYHYILRLYKEDQNYKAFKELWDKITFTLPWVKSECEQLEIILLMDQGRLVEAADRFSKNQWKVKSMINPVSFSFLSMKLALQLMEINEFEKALYVIAYSLPLKKLKEIQENKLNNYFSSKNSYFKTKISLITSYASRCFFYQLMQGQKILEVQKDYTPELLLNKAQLYQLCTRFYEAEILLREFINGNLGDIQQRQKAHEILILCLQNRGDFNEALKESKNYFSLYNGKEENLDVYFLRIKILIEKREYGEALVLLEQMSESFVGRLDRKRLEYYSGVIFYRLKSFDAAKKCFEQYLSLENGEFELLSIYYLACIEIDLGNHLMGLSLLESMLKRSNLDRDFKLQVILKSLEAKYANGSLDEVIKGAKQQIVQCNQTAFIDAFRVLLASAYESNKDLYKALSVYHLIDSSSVSSYFYSVFRISDLYLETKQYDKLICHLTRYVESHENECFQGRSEAICQLARVYCLQGDGLKASNLLKEAIGNSINKWGVKKINLLLQELFFHTEEFLSKSSAFEEELFSMLKNAKDSNEFLSYARLLCYAYTNIEDIIDKSAIEIGLLSLHQYIELYYLDDENLCLLGNFLQDIDLENANKCFKIVADRSQDNVMRSKAYLGLAGLEYKNSNYEKALEYISRYENSIPVDLIIMTSFLRAEIYLKQGKVKEADELFHVVLRSDLEDSSLKARALMYLASIASDNGCDQESISLYTRIYNMYRKESELVAKAYFETAKLFYKHNELEKSLKVMDEFMTQRRLYNSQIYSDAKEFYQKLSLLQNSSEGMVDEI